MWKVLSTSKLKGVFLNKIFHISNTRIYENRRTHEGQFETSLPPDSCIHDVANRMMLTCLEFYENFMMNRLRYALQLL